jgi:FtsP/CotA-like multicopper oxidase with cupredoxin domain
LRRRPSARFLSRRHLLIGGGISLLASAWTSQGGGCDATRTAATTPADDGVQVLKACLASVPLRGDGVAPTSVWCYGGSVPGPVLRVRRGEEVRLRLANELPQPTSIHWHGIRPPATGGMTALTPPATASGEAFEYRFKVPDAGTFWYHGRRDRDPLAQGLYGALIVEESRPVDTDRDVLLILDEWRFEADGSIAAERPRSDQAANPQLTANGDPTIDIAVKANERVRLRLINAAMNRGFLLRVDRHRAIVMAIDGEPTEPFEAQNGRVMLGPGNRLDLFVDTTLAAGDSGSILVEQPIGDVPVARLVYDRTPPARLLRRPDPSPLPANPLPLRMSFEQAVRVGVDLADDEPLLQGGPWTVAALAPAPLFSVRPGRTVILTLVNRGDTPQAVHVNGHHFRLLDNLDDGWKPFWLDTLTVPARQTLRLAFVADNPGRWLIERHLLMPWRPTLTAWFEVVAGHP